MNTNADRRFHVGWAIEAAQARRDQWLERANEENIDIDDVYEEKPLAAATIANGIGQGITVLKSCVTESEALMAMMIFEHALEDSGVMLWLKDGEGAYQARDNALVIAKVFMRASDWAYANGFDDSEDWEFIPRMLPVIMRKEFIVPKVTSDICMEAAQEVVRVYLDEQK